MVDFNNETTIARPRRDILIFSIMEHHHYIIQSIELYYGQLYQNTDSLSESTLRARIISFYKRIRTTLEEDCTNWEAIKTLCFAEDIDKGLLGFDMLCDFLHKNGVLQFGYKLSYDPSDARFEDEAKNV